MKKLWNDEAGFVVSSELVLIGTILVIGVTVGLSTLRDQVVQELGDLAISLGSINESYSYSGVTGHTSSIAGSTFTDRLDYCDGTDGAAGSEPACIQVNTVSASAEI
jgi:hypothetical protein